MGSYSCCKFQYVELTLEEVGLEYIIVTDSTGSAHWLRLQMF